MNLVLELKEADIDKQIRSQPRRFKGYIYRADKRHGFRTTCHRLDFFEFTPNEGKINYIPYFFLILLIYNPTGTIYLPDKPTTVEVKRIRHLSSQKKEGGDE